MLDVSDDDVAALKASGQFDERWYLAEYPDVAMTGMDPARHFLWIGRRLNRKPFADAAGASQPGVTHPHGIALERGGGTFEQAPDRAIAGGRKGAFGFAARLARKSKQRFSRRSDKVPGHVLDVVEQGFDADFYLTKYPDVAEAGVDPLEHYMLNGWLEGRDPSIAFCTRYYLDNNPDVVAAGVNPFHHYLSAGRAEGRAGQHQLGFRWDILSRLKPVAEQIAEHKAYRGKVTRSPRTDLAGALQRQLRGRAGLILSFSHDDFTCNVGGVQLLLRRELRMLQERDYLQLHIYPEHPLPFLDTSGERIALGVLLNGVKVGTFLADDIAACLEKADMGDLAPRFVVHSLLGQNMDQTIAILKAAGIDGKAQAGPSTSTGGSGGGSTGTPAAPGFLWLHDYAPLYNNYKLLRNDVEYRGIPRKGTVAWELCEFARADFSHADEFARLFAAFDIELLAPSKAALGIWQNAQLLKPRASRVIEHVTLREISNQPVAPRLASASGPVPLKVGFLGYPSDHKGWSVFQELVLRMDGDRRYEFHHLGKGRRGGLPVEYREVLACEQEPDLMRRAVSALELDVVMVWSIWPETFCLTAYEALAGGAVLLTNTCAGNIVDLVRQTGEGLVLDDEAELRTVFEIGTIMKQARARRTVRNFELDYSSVTLEALD